jgi:murein DD-endopeptidase MepM/ murein hydrolase activator NlpD
MSIISDKDNIQTLSILNDRILSLKKSIDKFTQQTINESKILTRAEEREGLLKKYLETTKPELPQVKSQVAIVTPDEFGISKPPEPEPIIEEEAKSEEEKTLVQRIGEGAAAVGSFALGGKYASELYIGPTGDRDGQQTGLDMNLPGGIGAPIYAPLDMIYRVKGTDGLPSVGLQGTADVRGAAGRGFGYYGSYFFVKDGRTYEVLLGHLASMGYKGSSDNQLIPKGTILGYQGASGRTVGANNQPYPHISLHVNGVGFVASNSVLVWFANLLTRQNATTVAPSEQKRQPPPEQKVSSAKSNNIIALVNQSSPQDIAHKPIPRRTTSSLNRNYGSFEEVLLAHTTFNVG